MVIDYNMIMNKINNQIKLSTNFPNPKVVCIIDKSILNSLDFNEFINECKKYNITIIPYFVKNESIENDLEYLCNTNSINGIIICIEELLKYNDNIISMKKVINNTKFESLSKGTKNIDIIYNISILYEYQSNYFWKFGSNLQIMSKKKD